MASIIPPMPRPNQRVCVGLLALAALVSLTGCIRWQDRDWDHPVQDDPVVTAEDIEPIDNEAPGATPAIPHPISLLLPKRIDIHPFTRTRPAEPEDQATGIIDVRVQLLDSFGDPVKGFGVFRFTLFDYRVAGADRRGRQLVIWEEDLSRPNRSLLHWDPISNAYKFNLKWGQRLADGQRYVLEAYFVSPYTDQLFDEQAFVAGQ